MKNAFYSLAFLSLFVGMLTTSSCGPSKKLVASEARADKLQKENALTQSQLNKSNEQVKNLNDEKASLQNNNANLQNDKASLQNDNANTQNDLNKLSTTSKMTIADQAKRLKGLQDVIQSQKDVMSKLKNSIAAALLNYKSDEISVSIKDGNVYVSLEEKLLFKSGSDVVDPKGKEALKTLAMVINNTKDIRVMIEGHTDNVPIKTAQFKDNWDLSSARATSIVRILTTEYGFDSNRITASGRGSFHPVKTNDTAEGRAGNRRTEIILSPDLNELFTLLNQ